MAFSLKEHLRDKKPTLGSWLSLALAETAEIMARGGFDWLVIDMEHSATTRYQAQQLIRTVELNGVIPLARVAENNPTYIKQAMDAGAQGIIVPMVNTAQQAQDAVDATKYAPIGERGAGLWRAHDYGKAFDEYRDWLATESVVIVQIEHREAVENLESILAVEGIDAFMIGPYDLSASLGFPGDFDNPVVVQALEQIDKRVGQTHISAGFHIVQPDEEMLKEKLDKGYTFIAYGVDMIYLRISVNKMSKSARKLLSL